jgi:ABC-2 type transport system permease protein
MWDRRLLALLIKETSEILRNRQLVIFLTVLPILSMVIFGYVLISQVSNLRLSVLDQNQVAVSRELVDAFTANRVFLNVHEGVPLKNHPAKNQQDLTRQVERGQVDAGLMIPPTFSRDLMQTGTSEVAIVLDGVNAYSSGLANGYATQIIGQFNLDLLKQSQSTELAIPLRSKTTFRYNPGIIDSWFYVPGVIGTLISMNAILTTAAEAVREKDQGTLEQLLMTPVSSTAILISKTVPISTLLTGTALICFVVARWVFELPFRGNLLLLLIFSILYIQIGVGIGLTIATLSTNKLQTILVAMFLTMPLMILSGSFTSTNSMPLFFRGLAQFNPVYHYLIILRGILLKGTGLEVWWPHAIAIVLFSIGILLFSANRYRSQLS